VEGLVKLDDTTKIPAAYARDAETLVVLFRIWVEQQSQTRAVDLQWYEWNGIAIGAPLAGEALDYLCASDDARAMCEWADQQSGHRCTLLQAMAAIETLGLKTPGQGKRLPPELLRNVTPISDAGPWRPSRPKPATRKPSN
jgi:hypothetical protein